MDNGQKIAASGATLVLAEAGMMFAHQGALGTIVAIGAGLAAYAYAEDIARLAGRDIPSLPTLPKGEPGKPSLAYRLLNGRSTREQSLLQEAETVIQGETDEAPIDGPFVFSDLLRGNWRPSLKSIYLAEDDTGESIVCTIEDLPHIALAGATRQGKTSILRQIMAQVCYCRCDAMLIDPHYTPYDHERDEDWRPFKPYLKHIAFEYDDIEATINHLANVELRKRIELRRKGRPYGKTLAVFIDEYPAIIAEKPGLQDSIGRLLREGAKFGIILCIASQDFQVKTTSNKTGGGVRENYKTCAYVGGDAKSTSVLLDMSESDINKLENEIKLGKGSILLRNAEVCKQAIHATTPYMDNNSLYILLGRPEDPPAEDDEQPVYTPSQASGFTPSATPSYNQAEKYPVKEWNEAARRSDEGVKEQEGVSTPFSEHEQRIISLFMKYQSVGDVAKEMSGSTGGAKYIAACQEVNTVLFKTLEVRMN
jgi:hypothetical protein